MKIVVILSGGMDSTTLLYDLIKQGHNVRAITYNYGQRHRKETAYAQMTCLKLGVTHTVVDLTCITKLISNSALTGDIPVPDGHYAEESMKKTVVPNRNMIMLAVAIGYAENIKFDAVAIANHAGDHVIYPDCRPQFVKAMDVASQLGTYGMIAIHAPYTDLTKGQIAVIGRQLGIDYEKDTWTCYKGGAKPCGTCGSCNERKEALEYAKDKN